MTQSSTAPLLMVRDVCKSFGAVAAVQGVSFPLHAGEVHALVGEKGAGKLTIVKMLAGIHRPDSGQIEIDGQRVELNSPADAKLVGIAVIYQELSLFPDLSVAENYCEGPAAAGPVRRHRPCCGEGYAGAALSSGQITGAEDEKFRAGKPGKYAIGVSGEIVLAPRRSSPPTTSTSLTSEPLEFGRLVSSSRWDRPAAPTSRRT